jgi:hypothetical protein
MSTLRVNNLTNQANDGGIDFAVQPVIDGLCKAWVNFNGSGTVAIRASYNVSSITDNGVGAYAVNFATAMVDVNYVAAGMNGSWVQQTLSKTTSAVGIGSFNSTNAVAIDTTKLDVAIFR